MRLWVLTRKGSTLPHKRGEKRAFVIRAESEQAARAKANFACGLEGQIWHYEDMAKAWPLEHAGLPGVILSSGDP